MPYLPYEEPTITVILSLTSFILLLNGVRYALDRLLYCGIIGEILIGIVWGLPVGGTAWLNEGTQATIQALGYLGLIGLVFEGGLSTDLHMLRKTAYMSISVATIGLLMPIALSFILLVLPFSSSAGIVYPTPLAGFSAGASLCSTSLGTTLAILSSAHLQRTRVGVVLVGAAMMDDVVGLVMVNIVTTLGSGGMGGWPIARPIVASFGLLLVTLVFAPFVLRPTWCWVGDYLSADPSIGSPTNLRTALRKRSTTLAHNIPHLNFVSSTAVLILFVTIASFIDASILFAAFIAGGVVNFLSSVRPASSPIVSTSDGNPSEMYQQYYKSVMGYILVPFFFASIGFSIPIMDMFRGTIVWKGMIYSLLMILGKGLVSSVVYCDYFAKVWIDRTLTSGGREKNPPSQVSHVRREVPRDLEARTGCPHAVALLVGFAMIARGEIGFLIASLSQSSDTLTLRHRDDTDIEPSGEDLFLVITWAVVICTITGPLGVGLIVKRLRFVTNESCTKWL